MLLKLILCCLWINPLAVFAFGDYSRRRPNIVIILADDLGINDVSFRGSNQFLTPNIDALAYHGIILDRYYVPPMCTPSRGSLMTGKSPIHIGLQHFVIPSDEPWGLPLDQKIMPEIFREAGYSTNLVGKWHLGFHKKVFTPTKRGFDSHLGYMGGYIDYFDHSLIMLDKNYSRGYDMRRNLDIESGMNGTYATDVFNDEAVRIVNAHDKSKPLFLVVSHLAPHTGNENNPMQAPSEEIERFSHISDPNRRTYAAMVSKLDEGVGQLVDALCDNNMLDNTILIFYSDNGAPTLGMHANGGSNYPFRGQKNGPWEGAMRSPGVIWSPLLKLNQRVSKHLMHVSDWLPTLAHAAGIKLDPTLKIDGIDMWDSLSKGYKSPRLRLLHNIDDVVGYSSYLRGQWKYVNGTTSNGKYDGWLGDIDNEADPRTEDYINFILNSPVSMSIRELSRAFNLSPHRIKNMRALSTLRCPKVEYTKAMSKFECKPLQEPCLFNIENDPCEYYNLAWKYPLTVASLEGDVTQFGRSIRPSVRTPADPRCDPALYNYTWTWWLDEIEDKTNSMHFGTNSMICLFVFLCLITIAFFVTLSFVVFPKFSRGRKKISTL